MKNTPAIPPSKEKAASTTTGNIIAAGMLGGDPLDGQARATRDLLQGLLDAVDGVTARTM